ncbi:MAG: hypothetical protein HPY90_07675 [Syntrophothermus sp.]|nr:hypothetical protein [Syntrophothermus sp.]
MAKYWENEKPIEVRSGKNSLRWYLKAGKLQISRPEWTDKEGSTHPVKTVILDVEALGESEDREKARKIFAEIVEELG